MSAATCVVVLLDQSRSLGRAASPGAEAPSVWVTATLNRFLSELARGVSGAEQIEVAVIGATTDAWGAAEFPRRQGEPLLNAAEPLPATRLPEAVATPQAATVGSGEPCWILPAARCGTAIAAGLGRAEQLFQVWNDRVTAPGSARREVLVVIGDGDLRDAAGSGGTIGYPALVEAANASLPGTGSVPRRWRFAFATAATSEGDNSLLFPTAESLQSALSQHAFRHVVAEIEAWYQFATELPDHPQEFVEVVRNDLGVSPQSRTMAYGCNQRDLERGFDCLFELLDHWAT